MEAPHQQLENAKMSEKARRAASLAADKVNEIVPLLHGLDAETTSAVLAQLVSMWVAGHVIFETDGTSIQRTETEAARHQVFAYWTHLVHQLIPISETEILKHSVDQAALGQAKVV